MDTELLRLFLLVAEQGSLTKAAQAMDTVQPVVTRRLNLLEKEVGGRLFHRHGRGVELSPLGQDLLPHAKTLVGNADSFLAYAKSQHQVPSGLVRLGAIDAFADALVPKLVDRMSKEIPQVRLRVMIGSIGRIEKWLKEGAIDISLNLGDMDSAAGDRRRLGTADTCLVGERDDPLLAGATVEFDALNNLPLVVAATSGQLRTRLDQIAFDRGITINPVLEIDMLKFQLSFAAQGKAYAVTTTQALQVPSAKALDLSYARIVNPSLARGILLGTNVQTMPSLATRRVHKMVQDISKSLKDAGDWQAMKS